MSLTQVLCSICVLASLTSAKGSGYYGGQGYEGGAGGYGGGQEKNIPKPYSFGYQAPATGGESFRQESGDGSGNVRGSYGYRDHQGLYRKVDYVANAGGFHAEVKTNEPGTDGKENPADVQMNVQEPPPGVQPQYATGGGYQKSGGGSPFGGIPYSSQGKSGY